MAEQYFLNCHTEDSIKVRWRDLSKKFHPDLHKSNPEMVKIFQEISDQRDKAVRMAYAKSGKSQEEIDKILQDFLNDLNPLDVMLGKVDQGSLNDIADAMIKQMEDRGVDLTDPTAVFKNVFGSLANAAGLKQLGKKKEDPKKIDKKKDRD